MSSITSSEKKGWKAILIATILSCFFLGFFYLAMTNEPDYMPSQKNKQTATHQMNGSSEQTQLSNMQMSDAEMKNMQHDGENAHK